MTAIALLTSCAAAGIVLTADGDGLDVDAPSGTLTPELLADLAHHKPALVELLTAFVSLRGGLTVPVAALALALNLEARGIALATNAQGQFIVPADDRLTPGDYAAIQRWRQHLGALVDYQAPTLG